MNGRQPNTDIKALHTKEPNESRIEDYLMSTTALGLDEIVGQKEAISELRNLCDSIKYKELYKFWKLASPKGILFTGPTGVGKTESIRATANELGGRVTLMELRYLDIASKYVDKPIEQLRSFFDIAEKQSKQKHVIIFIDEIDSMLPIRDSNLHETSLKRVNVFLEWMDGGFSGIENITIIGATNNPEGMDEAAKRPGRFDKLIKFNELDTDAIVTGLQIHFNKRNLYTCQYVEHDLNWDIVRPLIKTGSLSGADMPEIINRLVNRKVQEHKTKIEMSIPNFNKLADYNRNQHIIDLKYMPNPINSNDIYETTKEYINWKISIGRLSGSGYVGFNILHNKLNMETSVI